MHKNYFPILAGFLSLLSAPTSASPGRDHIEIVGESTGLRYARHVAESFQRKSGHKRPVISSTGSGGGMKLFCAGIGEEYPDITIAARRMTPTEYQTCMQNRVKDVFEITMGYEGLVFVEAKQPKTMNLSPLDIYLALAKEVPDPQGKQRLVPNPYQTWREVNPELPPRKIVVLGPPPTSNTRNMLTQVAMEVGCRTFDWIAATRKTDKSRYKAVCYSVREDGKYIEVGENTELIGSKLSTNLAAIAVVNYQSMISRGHVLQGIVINGVRPTNQTISEGTYALSRPLFLYTKKDRLEETNGLRQYVEHLLENMNDMVRLGLSPLPDNESQGPNLDAWAPMQIPLVKPSITEIKRMGPGMVIIFDDKNIGETGFRILMQRSSEEPAVSSLEGWTEIGRMGSHDGPGKATFFDDRSVDIPIPAGQQVDQLRSWVVVVAVRDEREAVSLPKKIERFSGVLSFDQVIVEEGRLRLRWRKIFDDPSTKSYRVRFKRRHPWEAAWVSVGDLVGSNTKGSYEYFDNTGQWASPLCYRLETYTTSSPVQTQLHGEICVDKGSQQHPEIPGLPTIENTHFGIAAKYTSSVQNCYFELRFDSGEYQQLKDYGCSIVPLDGYRQPGKQYCVLLVVEGSGRHTFSAREVCGTWPDPIKPEAPTEIRVRDKTEQSVSLQWHDNHRGEASNFIRRRLVDVPDDWAIVHEEGEHLGGTLSWIDETVLRGRRYEYQAGAVAESGARAFSNRIRVDIPGRAKACDGSPASESARNYTILNKDLYGCGIISIFFANDLAQAKQCAQSPSLSLVDELCNYTLVPTSTPANYNITELSNIWAASESDAVSCARSTCLNCTFTVTPTNNCVQ